MTFSMRRLSKIEEECKHYMSEIQSMHHQLQEQREHEVQRVIYQVFHSFFATVGALQRITSELCMFSQRIYLKLNNFVVFIQRAFFSCYVENKVTAFYSHRAKLSRTKSNEKFLKNVKEQGKLCWK